MSILEAKEEKKCSVASDEIITRLGSLADRSVGTKERLLNKLIPVMSLTIRSDPSGTTAERDYPPLFDDMRKLLIIIEQSLDVINDAIDRTEL